MSQMDALQATARARIQRTDGVAMEIGGAGHAWVALLIAVGALLATHWSTVQDLVRTWQTSADYSAGQLVPPVVLFLVWRKREELARLQLRPGWWGLGLVLLGQVTRVAGLAFLYESVERLALVITLLGLVLLLAGGSVFWRLRWELGFLFLMVPLPARIHNLISGPLQEWATSSAVFLLTAAGVTVDQEGHVILLNDSVSLAVAEACSGLRMLTAFIMVSAAFAFLVNRPRWQRVLLVLSSIPIALACNAVRLLLTAVLYLVTDSGTAESFFHDFAGVTMMPLAVLLLLGELALLRMLFAIPGPPAAPVGSAG